MGITMVELKFLTTKQAADYLSANGVRRTSGSLEVLRVTGGGPKFRKDGRRVVYDFLSLDEYITARLSPPLTSTSDHAQVEV